MRFCSREEVGEVFAGKTVALVGSGPGSLANAKGLIDSHDVVVRVNNYKLFPATGYRTDVFYSFFGKSIRKTSIELRRDGVKLCICKCPNAKFMESAWHEKHNKLNGVDFRYIYERRRDWWFCDTYVPSVEEFGVHFELLGKHIPTTGFSALLDIVSWKPKHIFVTGFDFFQSGVHNVNEKWRKANLSDPIGHDPAAERAWFLANAGRLPLSMDAALESIRDGTFKTPREQLMATYRQRRRGVRR